MLWQPGTAPQAPEETTVREPEQAWWEAQKRNDEPSEPIVTVAAVNDWDAECDAAAVAARLAQLAVDDELLVVYGADRPGADRKVLAGLRTRLPRHDVVALSARPDLAPLLGRLLEAGSLPVVLTGAAAMHDLTAELASVVRADRVVRIFRTATGADLYPVWRRPGLN
jgi:hypothetical protein